MRKKAYRLAALASMGLGSAWMFKLEGAATGWDFLAAVTLLSLGCIFFALSIGGLRQ